MGGVSEDETDQVNGHQSDSNVIVSVEEGGGVSPVGGRTFHYLSKVWKLSFSKREKKWPEILSE